MVERGASAFDALLGHFRGALAPRMCAIVTIAVTKALPLTSPAYDDGVNRARAQTGVDKTNSSDGRGQDEFASSNPTSG